MDLPYTLVPYFSTKEEAHCTPWLDDPAYLLQSCTLKYLIIMIFRIIFKNTTNLVLFQHLQGSQNSKGQLISEYLLGVFISVSGKKTKVRICRHTY